MDRLEAHRAFFANFITAATGKPNARVNAAFASIPREDFLGPGPWRVFVGGGYITTPSADPAFLYQDVTVAISEAKKINNGQPVLHAVCMAILDPKPGETVNHVGGGTGYYTAVLCNLVGATGRVFAYEIDTNWRVAQRQISRICRTSPFMLDQARKHRYLHATCATSMQEPPCR